MTTPPAWFSDAKLGIFIHWGIFSVPAFAPRGRTIGTEIMRARPDDGWAHLPYTEVVSELDLFRTAVARHHAAVHGVSPMPHSAPISTAPPRPSTPGAWADLFAEAGRAMRCFVTKAP